MDRAEMREEVRNRLGEDAEDFWKNTQIDRALDQAVKFFSRIERWPWLTSEATDALASGASTDTLPADLDFVRAFGIIMQQSGQRPYLLERVTQAQGLKLKTQYTEPGRPRWFYVTSAAQSAPGAGDETITYTVKFLPVADANYSVEYHYTRRPAKLTSDTQEPDMPEDYHEAIVAKATAELWLPELRDSGKYNEQMQLFSNVVEIARRDMYKLAEDEELVWGREADEAFGQWDHLPVLPDTYGMRYGWGEF